MHWDFTRPGNGLFIRKVIIEEGFEYSKRTLSNRANRNITGEGEIKVKEKYTLLLVYFLRQGFSV